MKNPPRFLLPIVLFCGLFQLDAELNQTTLQQEAEDWHSEFQQSSEGVSLGELSGHDRIFAAAGRMSEEGASVDENTLYEIGSITKVFTGVLLADTVLQGKAKLEDSISLHLPKGVIDEDAPLSKVTLLQLSTHTSGLSRVPADLDKGAKQADPYAHYSKEKLFDYLRSFEEDDFEKPGTYAYSNLAVGLLGEILAEIWEMSYEDLLAKRILEPLKMDSTFVQRHKASVPEDLEARFAVGHIGGKATSHWRFDALAGAGAMVSSVEDLLNFAEAHWCEDTPDYLKKAFELALDGHTEKVGLGWHFAEGLASHGGGTGGFRTSLSMDVENRHAKVSLRNSAEMSNEVVREGDFSDVVGFWVGALDLGARKLRLVLRVSESGEADMYSIDQGGSVIPSSKTVLENGELVVTYPSINGSYKATLKDGMLNGIWTQGSDLVLNMTRSEGIPESLASIFKNKYTGDLQPLLGFWSGKIGGDEGLFVYLEVLQISEFFEVKAWSPTQTPYPFGVSRVEFSDGKMRLESRMINGVYEGVINDDGKAFTGTWTQNNATSPLHLEWSAERPK